MSRPVRFHPAALDELVEAAGFYDLEGPGLGPAFLDAVERAVKQVRDFPDSSPMASSPARKEVISGFPYAVVYSEIDGDILVLALAHHRRRPFYWRSRA